MKTFNYRCENLDFPDISGLPDNIYKDDILYFDIETTGLSRDKNRIYLIGCGYYSNNSLNIIQWFSESDNEESLIIRAFADFLSSYSAFINYNGKSFDLPFICCRAQKYGINLELDRVINIDLYTYVKPYKKLLGLNDLKQKTLEQFLNIKRTDIYSGGELIDVYKKYVSNYRFIQKHAVSNAYGSSGDQASINKELLDKLLLHNKEDVLNMHYLLPLMKLDGLKDLRVSYVNHELHEYKGYSISNNIPANMHIQDNDINSGIKDMPEKHSYELIISASHNLKFNINFTSIMNIDSGTYAISCAGSKISLRIPVKCAELSYYFENYKDYYYLPNEKICVLKSVASGVAKENRENATKENCRVSLDGLFIYDFSQNPNTTLKKFKAAYNSKFEYIRLDDFDNMSDTEKSEFINSIIKCFC